MKNENNFIRESQTQPGNSYQCEHREHRRAILSQGPTERGLQRGAHRLHDFLEGEPWPGFSTVPLVGIAGTLKEAAEYHAHGALSHTR